MIRMGKPVNNNLQRGRPYSSSTSQTSFVSIRRSEPSSSFLGKNVLKKYLATCRNSSGTRNSDRGSRIVQTTNPLEIPMSL
ncbi:hypothetical protein JTB14_037162 [Gonioctena quinquepunctata]|nr:hypothetical protein JTB14_037162 [Gonioctena quinquepunctata]